MVLIVLVCTGLGRSSGHLLSVRLVLGFTYRGRAWWAGDSLRGRLCDRRLGPEVRVGGNE